MKPRCRSINVTHGKQIILAVDITTCSPFTSDRCDLQSLMTSLFPGAALVACLTDIFFLHIAVLVSVNAIFMRINFEMGV